jgi:hypothetical protein
MKPRKVYTRKINLDSYICGEQGNYFVVKTTGRGAGNFHSVQQVRDYLIDQINEFLENTFDKGQLDE